MMRETITLTFGEAGENHAGMQMIGTMGDVGSGFNLDDLKEIKEKLKDNDLVTTQIINLNELTEEETEPAHVLVIRNGSTLFVDDRHEFYNDLHSFEWDNQYYDTRRAKVLNKQARYNVCFDDREQEPDYENKKGRIVKFDKIPRLQSMRNNLHKYFGRKAKNMICEGNMYYDIRKCGIGWHGDGERKKVIGLRLGQKMNLKYQWFHKSKPIGTIKEIILDNGDMYIMSEKATGYDWKSRNKVTLRHCAGALKYTKPK